ncbi:MAG TPA: TetR/AcrR family transcriptional regulator [Alphaproteobacteria bacterium]|jgi:AcrR family transcriptional regulator|nr:TetR/AcrR family transcriptional regulator [Alphaproteobacteria bacterium]
MQPAVSQAEFPSRTVSLTPKSVATRAKLIAVAERLFADKGVEGVSLAEINRVARQRHSNACHYHFGSKDGLIQAILEKHVPAISANRNAMFDAMEVAGGGSLAEVVRAFVRPVAAKLFDPNGGKEFIRFNAQLVARHTLASRGHPLPYSMPQFDRLTRKLKAAMAARSLPDGLVEGRLMMAAIMLFHGLADYSRLRDAMPGADDRADTERFISDLETMIEGALTAPFAAGMVGSSQ